MMASEGSPASPSSADSVSKTAGGAASSATECGEAPTNVTSCGAPPAPKAGRQLATMKLNDSKAGMEGLDTDKINQVGSISAGRIDVAYSAEYLVQPQTVWLFCFA